MTPQQAAYLKSKGLNPDDFITVAPQEMEELQLLKEIKSEGWLKSLGLSAFESAGPSVAGQAGFWPTAIATTKALARTPLGKKAPWVPAVGGLAGGTAGAMGLVKVAGEPLQQAIEGAVMLPETAARLDRRNAMAKAIFPKATTVGELAPELLTAKPVTPTNIRNVARGIGNLPRVGFRNLEPVQSSALTGIASGAAMGAGIEGGRQAVEGEFDPTRLATMGLASGALVPRKPFQRALSGTDSAFLESSDPVARKDLVFDPVSRRVMPAAEYAKIVQQADEAAKKGGTLAKGNEGLNALIGLDETPSVSIRQGKGIKPKKSYAERPNRIRKEDLLTADDLKHVERYRVNDKALEVVRQAEAPLAYAENTAQKIPTDLDAPSYPVALSDEFWSQPAQAQGEATQTTKNIKEVLEPAPAKPPEVIKDVAADEARLKANIAEIKPGKDLAETPNVAKALETPGYHTRFQKKLKVEAGPTDDAEAIAEDAFKKLTGEKYQAVPSKSRKTGLFDTPPEKPKLAQPSDIEDARQQLARQGVVVAESVGPIKTPAGTLARGMNVQDQRLAVYDPKKATPDTLYHEGWHQFLKDLSLSKDPQDQKLVERIMKMMGNDEEAWVAAHGNFSAKTKARLAADRTLLQKLNDWYDDVEALFRVRVGNPDSETIMRYLENRRRHGRTYETNPAINPSLSGESVGAGGGEVKFSEETPSSTPEKIVSAAFRDKDTGQVFNTGSVHSFIKGMPETPEGLKKLEQGFITDSGRFIDRQQAEDLTGEMPFSEAMSFNKGKFQDETGKIKYQQEGDTRPISIDPDITPEESVIAQKYDNFTPNWFFRKTAGEINQIRYLGNTPESRKITNIAADGLEGLERGRRQFTGKYVEGFLRSHLPFKLKLNEEKLASQYLHEMRHYGKSDLEPQVLNNPRISSAINNLRNFLVASQKEKNDFGPMIVVGGKLRKAGFDPNYYPDVLSHRARQLLVEQATTPEAKDLRGKIIEHYTMKNGGDAKLAEKEADDYIRALGAWGAMSEDSTAKFNALRKAEGYGLPYEATERSVTRAMSAYFYRYASDMAYYQHVESDPIMRSIFNIRDQLGDKASNAEFLPDGTKIAGNNPVQGKYATDVFTTYVRAMTTAEQFTRATSRLVSSIWLGPRTGAVDFLSSFVHALPYIHVKDIPAILKGFENFRDAWHKSHIAGINRRRINALEFGEYSTNYALDMIQGGADLLSKWGLRQGIEKTTRALQFNLGRTLARNMFNYTPGADRIADRFFRIMGKGIKDLDAYRGTGNTVPDNVVDEVAAQWVERNQGTYDLRGLPKEAQQGIFAPFLSLARWSIEKMNVMYNDVYLPAKLEHDFGPLLKATLGGIFGGKMIEEIAQYLTGTLRSIPTVEEAAARGDTKDEIAAVATLLEYPGYFGLLSQVATDAIGYLHFGTQTPQGFITFPAWEMMHESIWTHTKNLAKGLKENPKDAWPYIFAEYFKTMMEENVQALRIVSNHAFDTDNVERRQMERQLKMFQALDSNKETMQSADLVGPDLGDISQREFREARTLPKAERYLEDAVSRSVEKGRGRLDQTVSNISPLYANIERIIPTLTTPEGYAELLRYKDFIEKAYGPEQFDKIVNRALTNLNLSEAKKAMVLNYIGSNAPAIRSKIQEDSATLYQRP